MVATIDQFLCIFNAAFAIHTNNGIGHGINSSPFCCDSSAFLIQGIVESTYNIEICFIESKPDFRTSTSFYFLE